MENETKITSKYQDLEKALNEAFNLLPKEFADKFLESPASTRFHQNYPGGLLEHSVKLGEELFGRTFKGIKLTVDECARIALYHDLCKVGLYIPYGNSYRCDKELYPHHGLLSVQRCEEFGIELSQTERVAILLHMAGAWWNPEDVAALTDDDKQWISNHFDILAAVQWADMKAC